MTLVSHCIKNHFTLKVKCTASLSRETRVILLPEVKEEDEERKGKDPLISHLKTALVMTLILFLYPQAKPAQLSGSRNSGEMR